METADFHTGIAKLKADLEKHAISDDEFEKKQKQLDEKTFNPDIVNNDILRYFKARYMDKTFDNYNCTLEGQSKAVAKCKYYAGMKKDNGESLFMYGKSGTGKNHLIVAICREMKKPFIAVKTEYLWEVKRCAQQTGQNWIDAMKPYIKTEMLIIPDLVVKQSGLTDSQKELLFYLIDERYNDLKPMIIATNININELKKFIDFEGAARCSDRLAEMMDNRIICMDWESYRKNKE